MKVRIRAAAWMLILAMLCSIMPAELVNAAEGESEQSYNSQHESEQGAADTDILKMMYVQQPDIASEAGQLIAVEAAEGNGTLTGAKLYYRDGAGIEQSMSVTEIAGNYAAFLLKGVRIAQSSITGLELTVGGRVHNIDVRKYQNSSDTLSAEVEAGPEQTSETVRNGLGVSEEELESVQNYVAADSEQIKNKLAQAQSVSGTGAARARSGIGSSLSKAKGKITIVLDPGHGGSDGGASRTWNGVSYIEKLITLKISKYTKQELETYDGVEVFLTRTDDRYVSLSGRVDYAASKKANAIISQHINSTDKWEQYNVSGAMVFVSKGQYNPSMTAISHQLAYKILAGLEKAGFKDMGIIFTLSTNGSTYPNGALADYYTIIEESVRAGIPGMIVEHGFVNNPEDCVRFYGSNAKIKKIGQADAKAIAAYYGLKKKSGTNPPETNPPETNPPETNPPETEPPVIATGWKKVGNIWNYLKSDGSKATGWHTIDGKTYYFDSKGTMAAGKTKIAGVDHYFKVDGEVMSGVQIIGKITVMLDSKGVITVSPAGSWIKKGSNWYFKKIDGNNATGWVNYKGKKCYLDSKGKMQTSWVKIKGKWHYFSADGYLMTGKIKVKGKTYYLSSTGPALTGKQVIAKKTVYLSTKGEIVLSKWVKYSKGWRYRYGDGTYPKSKFLTISGKKYYFDKNGYMETGWFMVGKTWYYANSSGAAATGWVKSGSKWYYVRTGKMLTNYWLKSKGSWYYLRSSGAMAAKGSLKIKGKTYRFDSTGRCTNK